MTEPLTSILHGQLASTLSNSLPPVVVDVFGAHLGNQYSSGHHHVGYGMACRTQPHPFRSFLEFIVENLDGPICRDKINFGR